MYSRVYLSADRYGGIYIVAEEPHPIVLKYCSINDSGWKILSSLFQPQCAELAGLKSLNARTTTARVMVSMTLPVCVLAWVEDVLIEAI